MTRIKLNNKRCKEINKTNFFGKANHPFLWTFAFVKYMKDLYLSTSTVQNLNGTHIGNPVQCLVLTSVEAVGFGKLDYQFFFLFIKTERIS